MISISQSSRSERQGFTIVELLIVIVIIAILAAITIVAYNGITNRANTSSAKSAAITAIKKIEAYNADDQGGSGSYPQSSAALTAAGASSSTYYVTGVTFMTGTEYSTKPPSPSVIKFYTCTTGSAVAYYDYTKTSSQWTQVFTGGATSGGCTYKNA